MLHAIRLICAAAMIGPTVLAAQSGEQDAATEQSLVAEFSAFMGERDRGFVASELILSRSFASHLHQSDTPLSIEDLSSKVAGYDPVGGVGATAGMLYFHLALPVSLLRELGGVPNEILARIIENRLRWLAGETDRAHAIAVELVSQLEDIGVADDRMTSLLADAAVLSWRAGQTDAANLYLTRAQACGAPRCPQDLVFEWLGENRQPSKPALAEYDITRLRDQALTDAAILWPGDDTVQQDIRLEAALLSDTSRDAVVQALDAAQAVTSYADLTLAQRRQFRLIATRIMGTDGLADMLMNMGSVAANVDGFTTADGQLVLNARDVMGYFDEDPQFTGAILRSVTLIQVLLQYSERASDAVTADIFRARLLIATGDYALAQSALQKIVGQARSQGFTDAQLHAALLDLWLVANLTGDMATAAQAAEDTRACRQTICDQDVVTTFFRNANALPKMRAPLDMADIMISLADQFVRSNAPDNMLALADLYFQGSSSNQPMDAARYSALAIRFAESATNITATDLQYRALRAMDIMNYAGLYGDAAEIGDRIIARLAKDGQSQALSERFYRTRARAAFRLGSGTAQGFYEQAVDRAIGDKAATRDWTVPESLALDLLDTRYLDVLDRLLSGQNGMLTILARLRYRQGRYQEAADTLQRYRRAAEVYGYDNSLTLATMFAEQAAQHYETKNLDAYVAATLAAEAASDRVSVPADHHLIYATNKAMQALAFQEAFYRDAADDPARARYLRALGGDVTWSQPWEPLADTRDPAIIAAWEGRSWVYDTTYDTIRDVIDMRDNGSYEAAARWMRQFRWVAVVAEANGTYLDAQTLWQMAFTFARVGETDAAFDLMNRAARIAATLSFEGAGGADGGTLQLLERDRWRYLLFVDIAWAAVSGQSPDEMMVVSRY